MKIVVLALILLSGCSTVNYRVLMKNCVSAGQGSNLYYCDQAHAKEIQKLKVN